MKALKIDKSFAPFVIVITILIVAVAIFWFHFDPSFGGTYQ